MRRKRVRISKRFIVVVASIFAVLLMLDMDVRGRANRFVKYRTGLDSFDMLEAPAKNPFAKTEELSITVERPSIADLFLFRRYITVSRGKQNVANAKITSLGVEWRGPRRKK